GGFMSYIILGFQTTTVQRTGHPSVFRTGYFDFGSGNPAAYGIGGYKDIMKLIAEDPVLKPMIAVITPSVTLFGIAGNFDIDASKTFFGSGVVPSDREHMRQWNEYHLSGAPRPKNDLGLRDDDPTRGVIGVGLARVLGLCEKLKVADCPAPPKSADANAPPTETGKELTALAEEDRAGEVKETHGNLPRIDLLAATAGGAPNVLSLYVGEAERQGVKELDDSFIAMHIDLAQQLLYGRGEHKTVGIVVQLHRTEDMKAARARMNALFKDKGLELEVRDFAELQPQYNQVIGLFGAIFSFIAVIMGVIVLFTVVNTMSMSVMERTNEIGTARAMGVRRWGIRRQFLLEGWMLGAIGSTLGLIAAAVLGFLINHAGLTWTPPGQAAAVPLRLLVSGGPLLLGTWIGLVIMATIASMVPANRAAKMQVVDALRHV
ncbi:MAG TPA: FtsX-like permease family protein, partial [Stellaceae bacterium]|nr:FtsX-like permease family protein [Stellaceae bacterium]